MAMMDDGLGNLNFSGYGIHAVGNASVDFTLDHKNKFSNSSRGVYAEGFDEVEVYDNEFDNIAITNEVGGIDNYGFGVSLKGTARNWVKDNHIIDCELGIDLSYFSNLYGPEGNGIVSNRISQRTSNPYRNGTGIRVANSSMGTVRIVNPPPLACLRSASRERVLLCLWHHKISLSFKAQ